MREQLLYLAIFMFGTFWGVCLVRYGIRIGNRLTIQAMNELPLDVPKEAKDIQEFTK
jgi:hypothetical protein